MLQKFRRLEIDSYAYLAVIIHDVLNEPLLSNPFSVVIFIKLLLRLQGLDNQECQIKTSLIQK